MGDNTCGCNSSSQWFGIPREEVDWFPTIDKEKCTNCLSCVSFCKKGVYENHDGQVEVIKPYNCVVGCVGCEKICPNQAISHPPKEYLTNLAKEKGQY